MSCQHIWVIDTYPEGNTYKARCRKCGEQRKFRDIRFRYDVVIGRQRPIPAEHEKDWQKQLKLATPSKRLKVSEKRSKWRSEAPPGVDELFSKVGHFTKTKPNSGCKQLNIRKNGENGIARIFGKSGKVQQNSSYV